MSSSGSDPMDGHHPNLTVSSPSERNGGNGSAPVPRDPNQPIHKKPRVFIHRPNEDPAEEDEALKNTSLITAARTIQLEDFKLERMGKMPCFREAMLPSIGAGFGVGALRFILGGSLMKGLNFASGSFVAVSVVMYNLCQRSRRIEKNNIRQAVKVLDEKQKIKEAEEARKAALKQQEAAKSSIWNTFKFW